MPSHLGPRSQSEFAGDPSGRKQLYDSSASRASWAASSLSRSAAAESMTADECEEGCFFCSGPETD